MQSQIGKWGNSLAFRIPKHAVLELELQSEQTVVVTVENGKLIIEPVKNTTKYSLDELLEQEMEDDEEISWGKPEGKEVW